MDLSRHLLDNANPPSAFVSTSRDFRIARDFGEYVYVVRVRNGLNTNVLVWKNSPMQEISIPWRVDPSDIRGVTLLRADGTPYMSILNPNYQPRLNIR